MDAHADARAYEALSKHPRLADLIAVTRAVLTAMAETRRSDPQTERATTCAKDLSLTREAAATPFGNVLEVLERGPEDDAERALTCGLAAHVAGHEPPKDPVGHERLAADVLWLAANTPFDGTGLIDRALGDDASALWKAIAERVRRFDRERTSALSRGEALVGAMALAGSRSPAAREAARTLAGDVRDPKLVRVLNVESPADTIEPMTGALAPVPRGPFLTAFLAVTGLLLAVHLVRLVGRVALAYRRPATVSLADEGGVRVKVRTELLGRTLRDRDLLVPRAAIARIVRDVRYPGLRMYAGLLGLAVGSYVGVGAFVDGVRAASPSLLVGGLAIVALGLGLDFVLTSATPAARGTCRVLLVSRDGVKLCIGSLDARRADAMLARLARP